MGKPLLTVLNYSGGKQSSCLLWMVILGDYPKPESFIALNADPGIENSRTYEYIEIMMKECEKAGIHLATASGPNLLEDLRAVGRGERFRVDNPPYWTKDPNNGSRGQLMHKCTRHYKVAPMDRYIRGYLEEHHGISRKRSNLGEGMVEKWIGFSLDEELRIRDPRRKYIKFRYPLIELGMTDSDIIGYFKENGLPIPERSVCNACFSNGLATLKKMHDERPDDWKIAVELDEAIRDMSSVMVERTVFVNDKLMPLSELAEKNFLMDGEDQMTFGFHDADDWSCDKGYCFV